MSVFDILFLFWLFFFGLSIHLSRNLLTLCFSLWSLLIPMFAFFVPIVIIYYSYFSTWFVWFLYTLSSSYSVLDVFSIIVCCMLLSSVSYNVSLFPCPNCYSLRHNWVICLPFLSDTSFSIIFSFSQHFLWNLCSSVLPCPSNFSLPLIQSVIFLFLFLSCSMHHVIMLLLLLCQISFVLVLIQIKI